MKISQFEKSATIWTIGFGMGVFTEVFFMIIVRAFK